jgi:hypothetical protein
MNYQPNPNDQQPPQYPQQPYPPSGYPQPPQQQPMQPQKKKPGLFKIGCGVVVGLIVLIIAISVATSGGKTTTPSSPSNGTNQQQPQPIHYPPTTLADLRGLAAKGDANAIHEFHSESVGLTGVCPQPKREVTVDPSITGQQLAEDLLAYFYAQKLDSDACGSVIFAYHNQSEAGDAYTAGRILIDTTDSSGQDITDPNATNVKYKLTLDVGDVGTGKEYIVAY